MRRLMLGKKEDDDVKEWKLIHDETLETDSAKVFDINVNGYTEFYVVVDFPAQTEKQVKIFVNDTWILSINSLLSSSNTKYATFRVDNLDGYYFVEFAVANGKLQNNYSGQDYRSYPILTGQSEKLKITSNSAAYLFAAGTAAKVWAR